MGCTNSDNTAQMAAHQSKSHTALDGFMSIQADEQNDIKLIASIDCISKRVWSHPQHVERLIKFCSLKFFV